MNSTKETLELILNKCKDKEYIVSLDLDGLSRMQISLATHNAFLGQIVADLEKISNEREASFEFQREEIYATHRKAGETIADADNYKRIEAESARQLAINANHDWKQMANLRKDVMNLIEAVRSRLSLLKDERRTSNETQNT